ncbi:hypothetical protein [Opitutus terrae]|uniref:Uncharacterized protein n=1 Tax=Opitutus terrae (strain DSM 11246 / JCM 15787 / PB90-1) TaxID=452637 RepID=B1ZPX9_OPITP|nr:hypothetical protein [Opitutus terrae]ACB77700.1 hypothetical protein Oter_4429 [Opitutus terrae PB90-1]
MKTIFRILAFVLPLSGISSFGMPLLPHRANGVVTSVDTKSLTLDPLPEREDRPAAFVIVEGRTRLRKDGKKAAAGERPPVGQSTRIYYRKELGLWVAIEVAWRSKTPLVDEMQRG